MGQPRAIPCGTELSSFSVRAGISGFPDSDLRGDLRCSAPECCNIRGCHQLDLEHRGVSGEEQPKENKVTKIASGFLGVVVLIALAAGGGFYAFTKQKQKKQAEKEALDPDANYTEDKGDFEIPVEDEPEEPGEEDTEPI